MGPIFTIDARDNFFLDVVKETFNLTTPQIFQEINTSFNELIKALNLRNIKYENLKTALIPNQDRKEIALVFDSSKIKSTWYGYEVFKKIIPLFNIKSNHSILSGDLIGSSQHQIKLRELFYNNIKFTNECDFLYSNQFFLVYVNNVSDEMLSTFDFKLAEYEPYVGYLDLTFASKLKTYISTILVKSFIKHKNVILMPNEEDSDEEEDINIYGYPFEENNYLCKNINSLLYELFLSYKIEREVFGADENDFAFSINAVSKLVHPIDDFTLEIEDKKMQYILNNKKGKLKKADLINLERKDLELLISSKLKSNYIYNMVFLEEHNTIKFNIVIEFIASDTLEVVKMLVALEYLPELKVLRLITMF